VLATINCSDMRVIHKLQFQNEWGQENCVCKRGLKQEEEYRWED